MRWPGSLGVRKEEGAVYLRERANDTEAQGGLDDSEHRTRMTKDREGGGGRGDRHVPGTRRMYGDAGQHDQRVV